MSSSQRAVNELNSVVSAFESKVDGKVSAVDSSMSKIKSTTDRVYNRISDFKREMIENEEKQLAHEIVIRLDQVLKEQYGDHEDIRKTVMGIVKDCDINLVRNQSIQEISEELWITSSRYWLSYALIAISAWINNYRDVANNALRECVRRDPVKATLFFCLLNLRFGRNQVAKAWFREYFKTVDPEKVQNETAIIIQAFLGGIFGSDAELEETVNGIINSWMVELNSKEDIAAELAESYYKYIKTKKGGSSCSYKALPKTCSNYSEIEAYYKDVSKYNTLIREIDALDDAMGEQTDENYKARLDQVLKDLISNYDEEELAVRKDQVYYSLVIEHDGKLEAAKKAYDEYVKLTEEFNIGAQMIKWAVYDNSESTNVHVRKFSLERTKIWYMDAVNKWDTELWQTMPRDYNIRVDTWSCVSNGKDQAEQVEKLKDYYEKNKFSFKYINNGNIVAVIALIFCAGLSFASLYFLVGVALALGFLVFNILKANKEYPIRVENAVALLTSSMTELSDFSAFCERERAKKDELLAKIDYI